MKILVLINALVPGGAERQAVQDANLLSSLRHEVFFCFGSDGLLKNQLCETIELCDLKTKSQIKAIPKLVSFIAKNDIGLVMSHMFWANKVASVACFATRKKNIAFEHGLGLWRKWHHLMLVRLVARKAAAVITCSEASRQIRINRDKIAATKVKVIHNSFADPDELTERNVVENFSRNACFTIGFAGRFNKVKQLHLLIDLAFHLKKTTREFRFVLLGDGSEKPTIEKLVQESMLEEHFIYTGYVQNPLSYLKQMDCFVLPSIREDFSLALLEASHCGLPCLAFDVGGNREIILNGVTGWVIEPFDVVAMADKLLYLKCKPNQLEKMKRTASQRARTFFSQKKRKQHLIELIEV